MNIEKMNITELAVLMNSIVDDAENGDSKANRLLNKCIKQTVKIGYGEYSFNDIVKNFLPA